MLNEQELTRKLRQIKELQRMGEELNSELESLKDEVKAEMSERNVDDLTVDIFRVRWTTVTTNRFDTKSFKTAHSDLYNEFTKPNTSRRFTVD